MDETFDMLVAASNCCTCRVHLMRGTLVRWRPVPGKPCLCQPQCGPCAARELLPIWDEEQRRKGLPVQT